MIMIRVMPNHLMCSFLRMKFKQLCLSVCLASIMGFPAYAAMRSWDGDAGTTNWFTASNWSSNARPNAGDTAVIDIGSGVAITTSGAVASQLRMGTTTGTTGNLTISGTGSLTTNDSIYLGFVTGGQCQLGEWLIGSHCRLSWDRYPQYSKWSNGHERWRRQNRANRG